MYDSSFYSETDSRRDSLKRMAVEVKEYLKNAGQASYSDICQNIYTARILTAKRRVYDVLSVMRAINLIRNSNKKYFYIGNQIRGETEEKKHKKIAELEKINSILNTIINRNKTLAIFTNMEQRFYFPFTLIVCKKNSELKIESEENKKYYKFISKQVIVQLDDIVVLERVLQYENKEN